MKNTPHLTLVKLNTIIRHAVLSLLCFSLNLGSLTAQKLKTIDIYLLAGQSNATGQGMMANLPEGFIINKKVLIFHSGKPHLQGALPPFQWHPLVQSSESPDLFGPELGFGNRMQELYPGRKIGIIKHAHTATNIRADWNPGADKSDTLHFGPQFKVFVQTVDSALRALKKLGFTPQIKGMLWQQGEGDGGVVSGANYGKNLVHFIDRVRQQYDTPNMLFIYGYVYPPPTKGQGSDAVRQAEHDIDQDSKSTIAVKNAFVVPTDDLSQRAADRNTRFPDDHVHFGTNGILQLGIRMADKIHEKLQ